MNRTPLTEEMAEELIQDYQTFAKLSQTTVVTRDSDAHKESLKRKIVESLANHGPMLLTAFLCMKRRYEPLTMMLASVVREASVRSMVAEGVHISQTGAPAPEVSTGTGAVSKAAQVASAVVASENVSSSDTGDDKTIAVQFTKP